MKFFQNIKFGYRHHISKYPCFKNKFNYAETLKNTYVPNESFKRLCDMPIGMINVA